MGNTNRSNYIVNKEEKVFELLTIVFLVSTIVMPPYFGIPVPGFDLTAMRMMIIALLVMICFDRDRLYDFFSMIKYDYLFYAAAPYLFVIIYTTVLRVDVKAFLNPFIEFLTMFLAIYAIGRSLGVEKSITVFIACYYIFVYQGIIEYFRGESLFKLLRTLNGTLVGGNFIRGGHYRIMGPAAHSIAYGLMLNIGLPLAALDVKNKKLYMFQRPILFILIFFNILFTGSRAAFAVFFVEVAAIFLLSEKNEKKRTILVGIIGLIVFSALMVALSGTSVGSYFMLQITSVIDEVFGTSIAVNYGATAITQQSSDYRDSLWLIFKLKWLNPLVGVGRSRTFTTMIEGKIIDSIDNFYIAEYIRYAYPGMFSVIFFFLFAIVKMVIRLVKSKDAYTKVFLISTVAYCISLYFVDSLGTLKYLYIILALFVCSYPEDFMFEPRHRGSKYLRQAK